MSLLGVVLDAYILQLDSDEEELRDAAAQVTRKKATIKKMSQDKNKLQNRPIIPRKKRHLTLSEVTAGMRSSGIDPSTLEKRAKRLLATKQAEWEAANERDRVAFEAAGGVIGEADGDDDGDVDMDGEPSSARGKKGRAGAVAARAPGKNRQLAGMANSEQAAKANELRYFAQRGPARLAKASESDRHIPITRPKWMLAGKRKAGKTDRR